MTRKNNYIEAFSVLPADALALLKPIETQEEYNKIVEMTENLSMYMGDDVNHPLNGLFETLVEHIEAYEAVQYPLPDVEPHKVLAFLMEKQNLRQAELAEKLHTTQATVSRLVSGQMKFTVEWIDKIAQALGVSGSVFIGK